MSEKHTESAGLKLPTLLSQVLVAFTIEFDNAFELLMPHRTTDHGAACGGRDTPWLGSMVLWFTCMRFVDDGWIAVRDVERLAGTRTNVDGMRRWGYVRIADDAQGKRGRPSAAGTMMRATPGGMLARDTWSGLFSTIEQRWRARFGPARIEQLRAALCVVASRLHRKLPDCMPILGYGLFSRDRVTVSAARDEGEDIEALPLPALLARVLVGFALDYENAWPLSLAISANVLRVLDRDPVPARNLPRLTGVSKEAISMAMGILHKNRMAETVSKPTARARMARLTERGVAAQAMYRSRLDAIDTAWRGQFGADAIALLSAALGALVGGGTAADSPLFLGLTPDPNGWRASVPRPETLPHFPTVLHRGGFPDGS